MDADELAGAILDAVDRAVAPLLVRIGVLELRAAGLDKLRDQVVAIDARSDPRAGDMVAAIRERLATLETRAPVPGPPGANGKDGLDGFGFDDLDVTTDGEHAVEFAFRQGDRVRTFALAVPWTVYRGVYVPDRLYVPGDVVTFAGSAWVCRKETTGKPGDDSDFWTLAVKRGRDGRDR